MTNVVIAACALDGHVLPLRGLAVDLVKAGYRVIFTTGEAFGEGVRATGAEFVPLQGIADLARLDMSGREDVPAGLPRLEFDLKHLFGDVIPDQHRTVQSILSELPENEPAVVLFDTAFTGLLPVLLGAPGRKPSATIGLGVLPLIAASVDVPPPGSGLPLDPTPEGRERNAGAWQMLETQVFAGVQAHVQSLLAGLGTTESAPFFMGSTVLLPDRFLMLSVPGLDYPRSDAPAGLGYVGMVAPPEHSFSAPAWWAEVTGAARPVVFVTQGTLANADFGALLQPTLDALADLDALVIATAGRAGTETAQLRVPANARLIDFLPYEQILPHADVMVSNAGFGGVQQALAAAVPLVLAGDSEDKPEVAARAAWAGAAVDLRTGRPEPEAIRDAVETVLRDSSFQLAAKRLAAEYAQHDASQAVLAAIHELTAH